MEASAHTSGCDVFVKLGGSILDDPASTAELIPHLTTLSGKLRLLILTGGGQAAKRIKANQSAHGRDLYLFWRATALCPEVNAYLLASYSSSFAVVSCAAEIATCFEAGKIAVFIPAGAILNNLCFMPDWLVTTDSMGLYFAHTLGARRYVIVSDVHGIYERKPENGTSLAPIPYLGIDELERLPSSKVDSGFVRYYRRFGVPTIVVNGKHPSRVSAAICGTPTIGTEISLR